MNVFKRIRALCLIFCLLFQTVGCQTLMGSDEAEDTTTETILKVTLMVAVVAIAIGIGMVLGPATPLLESLGSGGEDYSYGNKERWHHDHEHNHRHH